MNELAERKILTAMMLLEMCEHSDDPAIMDKLCAAHSFVQSAWSDMTGRRVEVSAKAQALVAQIHAGAAIEEAREVRR